MSKILKYKEYILSENKALEIIENICNPVLKESTTKDNFDSIARKLSKDLKFNFGLIASFGVGIKLMVPVVSGLIESGSFSFEATTENLILLTITIVAITYLEETSNKSGDPVNSEGEKSLVTKKDAQTMLEELKLRGLGQGIVKKFVGVFKSIGSFFKNLFKDTPYIINGLLDMFGYTALLLPCLNAISVFIGKYDLTLDSLAMNLMSVGIGVTSIIAKQGVSWLVNKIKKSLNIKNFGKGLDKPIEIKPYDAIEVKSEEEMINEQ